MKSATQDDIKFLLKHGWRLVGINTVESPCGQIVTDDIEKAARAWRTKLQTIQKIDKSLSNKFLRSHLTKRNLCVKLFL